MSRYHAQRSLERMLEASQHWKEVALLSDGAIFAEEPVMDIAVSSRLESILY